MDVLRRPTDELPTGVFGRGTRTILLPTLSKHAASQDTEQFSGLLDWGLRLCMLLTLPACCWTCRVVFPLWFDLVHVPRVYVARRTNDPIRADCLFLRLDRSDYD